MAPPPSERRPSWVGDDSDPPPPPKRRDDDDEPATRQELRAVVKHVERRFSHLQDDFERHRHRVSADITGAVRAAVVDQIEPHAEKLDKLEEQNNKLEAQSKEMYTILLKQESRAAVKAEQNKEKEAARKNRIAWVVACSPIIVALIAAWSVLWSKLASPPPPPTPQQHIEAR